jgi:hypothetical protein
MAPLQPGPDTDQVTAVLPVLVTVAVNCWAPEILIDAEVGDTVTPIGGGVLIVTVATADFVTSACEVAVTVTVLGAGAVEGAVYSPAGETVPHAAPEHPVPLTDHVTALIGVPVTVAVNCCVAFTFTVDDVGDTETATGVMVTLAAADLVGST